MIIANPVAGWRRRLRRRLDRLIDALQRRGCTVVVRHSGAQPGDAERLAREAEPEFAVVVAAGGDGTINEVANGLAATDRTLAVLPFGTVNVLAREIGLPRDPERLAGLIAGGRTRPIWPGRVGDRLFLMMASSGFDAVTVASVGPRLKRHIGRLAFVWAAFVGWCRYRPIELTVRVAGEQHRAAGVIAAKGRFYAGSYVVAPRADLAEPALDLVLLQASGRIALLRYLCALLLGTLARRRDVTIIRATEASVSAAAPSPVQADGEIVGNLPIRIAVAAQPLQLIQP